MRMQMLSVIGLVALAGCNGAADEIGRPLPRGALEATATLRDAGGAVIGRALARDVHGGLRITLEAAHLPAGAHGVHLHAVGRCDPPDFSSAGGHWNPNGAHHGTLHPAGPHLGDLPNLLVPPGGHASLGANIPGASVSALLDADGAAIVVHADRDDMITDPSGNSGMRIGCGVFVPS